MNRTLGDRAGSNAAELLLGALGSYLSVGYAANAAHIGIKLNTLRMEIAGDIDLRGFLGISKDIRPSYESISGIVYADVGGPKEELNETTSKFDVRRAE